MKRQKANSLESITWSKWGNANAISIMLIYTKEVKIN